MSSVAVFDVVVVVINVNVIVFVGCGEKKQETVNYLFPLFCRLLSQHSSVACWVNSLRSFEIYTGDGRTIASDPSDHIDSLIRILARIRR